MYKKQAVFLVTLFVTLLLGLSFAHADEGDNPTAWVANGADNSLSVIDRVTGEELARVATGMNPHILTISPDGQYLYVVNAGAHDTEHHPGKDLSDSATNSLWVHDAQTGEVISQIAVGQGPTHPIASLDGERIYVTNTDEGSVSVIDTASWQVVSTIGGLAEPHDGALSPNGSRLYLATSAESSLTVVDTASLEIVNTMLVGTKPRGVVAGGLDGQRVYVSNKGDGTVSFIDLTKGSAETFQVGKGAHALRLSPDGSTLYVSLSSENRVALVDSATGEVLQRLAVGAGPEQLDLSADGNFLAISNNIDASLSLIDLNQNLVVRTVAVGQGAYGTQFSNLPFHSE